MKKLHLLKLSALVLIVSILASCGGNDDNYVPSSNCHLSSFHFTSVNSGITGSTSGIISREFAPDNLLGTTLVLITVPESCDLSGLKASFTIDDKATFYINEAEQISGETAANYTGLTKAKVVAEDGTSLNYEILVKKGDPVIDAKIYNLMKTYSIPGISVSVTKGDEIIYNYGYGFADVSKKEPVTPKHLFRLASISKQFTTLCIMKLYEESKLNLDDKVFGTGGVLDQEFPGVTGNKANVSIRNFLQHNSGWNLNPDPMFNSPYKDRSVDEQIIYMLNTNQATSVGSTYSYLNLGFGVLGKIIEKVSGKPYEEYLKEVMALAGITDVHVGKTLAGKRSNECIYYSQNGSNGYGNNMEAIAAAGGVIASTEEMMKLIVQIDGKGTDILKKATIDELYTPSPNYSRYALGWRVGHTLYPGAHYHSGNLAGTATIWCGDANSSTSAAILMNSRSYISSPSGDFDDAYYILLGDVVAHFK